MNVESDKKRNIIFEKNENLSNEDKKRKNTIIFFLIFLVLFAIIALDTIQKLPTKYTGKEEYYEIEEIQIPTLYKYTGHANAFMAKEVKDLEEGDIKGSFISVFYREEISDQIINTYIEEMEKIGYKKISYDGSDMYVKNNEDNTKFAYIFINKFQVKYGVCVSGKYEDILKEENELNVEDNLNTVK